MQNLEDNNLINITERQILDQHIKSLSYPYSDENFEYLTLLSRVNLDEKRKEYISQNKGFIIARPQSSTKKDMKDPYSIFSTKFGQTLNDVDAFANRYRCSCKNEKMMGKIFLGAVCPICGTKVKYVDDDFEYFGWLVLQEDFYVIHPNMFKSIEFYIGKHIFNRIIEYVDYKDINGHSVEQSPNEDEPFAGIGMIKFRERFDEIMKYYYNKYKRTREQYYFDIMEHKDIVFTQSIGVFTLLLRPLKLDGKTLHYEGTNSLYNMMSKLVAEINNNKLKINRKKKQKNQLLYDLQLKYQELYAEIVKIIEGKKGTIRQLFGGRYQFTGRNVIVSDSSLRIDQVSLSYYSLVELLQQRIINILQKLYNFSYDDAYKIWYNAQKNIDKRVVQIIEGLIKNDGDGKGIPILLNRNKVVFPYHGDMVC